MIFTEFGRHMCVCISFIRTLGTHNKQIGVIIESDLDRVPSSRVLTITLTLHVDIECSDNTLSD